MNLEVSGKKIKIKEEKTHKAIKNKVKVFQEFSKNFLLQTKKALIDFENDEVLLHERLGGGGSGATIYRCTISGFTFAAKILKTETSEEVIDAIKKEIHIMVEFNSFFNIEKLYFQEQLSHPNIVRYLAHDLTKRGEIRLYLEYYTSTLHNVIMSRRAEKKYFTVAEICNYLFQMAKGLNYIHNLPQPIVHRQYYYFQVES